MNSVNKTNTKYVVKITDGEDLRIASKLGDIQELEIILQDKEQLKLKHP